MPALDRTLTALAHPVRRKILERVMRAEARVTDLAEPFAMSLNAVPFYARSGFRALGGEERLSSTGVVVPIVRMEKRLG